jgi:phage-related protein
MACQEEYNQEQADGSNKKIKEYPLSYSCGIASATTADSGDVVLAKYT